MEELLVSERTSLSETLIDLSYVLEGDFVPRSAAAEELRNIAAELLSEGGFKGQKRQIHKLESGEVRRYLQMLPELETYMKDRKQTVESNFLLKAIPIFDQTIEELDQGDVMAKRIAEALRIRFYEARDKKSAEQFRIYQKQIADKGLMKKECCQSIYYNGITHGLDAYTIKLSEELDAKTVSAIVNMLEFYKTQKSRSKNQPKNRQKLFDFMDTYKITN